MNASVVGGRGFNLGVDPFFVVFLPVLVFQILQRTRAWEPARHFLVSLFTLKIKTRLFIADAQVFQNISTHIFYHPLRRPV